MVTVWTPLPSLRALTQDAATNVSRNSRGLVRGKVGNRLGAWAAFIATTAHKVMESRRAGHGKVWQVMFLCKLTERLGEAEQLECYTQGERGNGNWFHDLAS